jgi:hypothetical protein
MTSQRPTPEQQRATAERYRGQRARQVHQPTELPHAPQQVAPPRTRAPGAWKHALWRLLVRATVWSVIALVAGIVLTLLNGENADGNPHSQFLNTVSGVLIAPICVMAFIWLFVVIIGMLWGIHTNLKVAVKPIPSLAEIEAQLRAEGYNPSIQDVIAVEQHLKSERNEAALLAGGMIVGLDLMARKANGKHGL